MSHTHIVKGPDNTQLLPINTKRKRRRDGKDRKEKVDGGGALACQRRM